MAQHMLLVITNPLPGQEDEYNRWYDEQHLGEVLQVPGFVSAQRFKLSLEGAGTLPAGYLAVYEMETDDPEATFAGLGRATADRSMHISPALDAANSIAMVYTPITAKKFRKPD